MARAHGPDWKRRGREMLLARLQLGGRRRHWSALDWGDHANVTNVG